MSLRSRKSTKTIGPSPILLRVLGRAFRESPWCLIITPWNVGGTRLGILMIIMLFCAYTSQYPIQTMIWITEWWKLTLQNWRSFRLPVDSRYREVEPQRILISVEFSIKCQYHMIFDHTLNYHQFVEPQFCRWGLIHPHYLLEWQESLHKI
jgi:hypothetical protein